MWPRRQRAALPLPPRRKLRPRLRSRKLQRLKRRRKKLHRPRLKSRSPIRLLHLPHRLRSQSPASASSLRRLPAVSPGRPVSTSRPFPVPARMAASLRPTWKRLPLPVVRRQLLPPQHPQAHRLRHLPRVRPTKPFSSCSSRVPTSWCRMTACARSLPSVWSNPSRPFRISTFPWIANWIRFWRCAPSSTPPLPKGRQARLQAFGQRHGHQGAGSRAARRA